MSCLNCGNYENSGVWLAAHMIGRRVVIVADRPKRIEPGINRVSVRIPDLDRAELAEIVMAVTRPNVGAFVMYPAFERDESGAIVFLLDDEIFKLPAGRYLGQIAGAGCCWRIQLELAGCSPIESVTLDHQPEYAGRGD